MSNSRGSKATAFTILAVAFGFAACSGGGGGSTPTTPASVTVTCPNGTAQTAATTALANAACPAPVMLSIDPANLGITSTPDSLVLTGIVVATDSVLDPASLTTANVTLKVGSLTSIAGTVSATDTKGFKFVPAAKLQYGQAYDFVADVKDSLGKILAVRSSFSTSLISCTAPQVPDSTGTTCVAPLACLAPAMQNSVGACMLPPAPTGYTWNNIIKAWVADIGVLVTGANTLPATCVTIGDKCWLDSVADGTIKFVYSNALMPGFSTRHVVFAFYKGNFNGTNYYGVTPMYADVEATSAFANQGVSNGGNTDTITEIKGSQNGVKQTAPSFGCWERVWQDIGFGNIQISCPI